jgi:hypothetical protein
MHNLQTSFGAPSVRLPADQEKLSARPAIAERAGVGALRRAPGPSQSGLRRSLITLSIWDLLVLAWPGVRLLDRDARGPSKAGQQQVNGREYGLPLLGQAACQGTEF